MRRTGGIRVRVDVTNPGQFLACCGLLELADRFRAGAQAWFADGVFAIAWPDRQDGLDLRELFGAVSRCDLHVVDPEDDMESPLRLGPPFDLRLDWWKDDRYGGRAFKTWAGSMRAPRIARAMQRALLDFDDPNEEVFDRRVVVSDPDDRRKKVEPFYFDALRGANARPIDVGFSPDALEIKVTTSPIVELGCLVGLQRFRPRPETTPRTFTYHVWTTPAPLLVASAIVPGSVAAPSDPALQFGVRYRTDQRKHKAFMQAVFHGRS